MGYSLISYKRKVKKAICKRLLLGYNERNNNTTTKTDKKIDELVRVIKRQLFSFINFEESSIDHLCPRLNTKTGKIDCSKTCGHCLEYVDTVLNYSCVFYCNTDSDLNSNMTSNESISIAPSTLIWKVNLEYLSRTLDLEDNDVRKYLPCIVSTYIICASSKRTFFDDSKGRSRMKSKLFYDKKADLNPYEDPSAKDDANGYSAHFFFSDKKKNYHLADICQYLYLFSEIAMLARDIDIEFDLNESYSYFLLSMVEYFSNKSHIEDIDNWYDDYIFLILKNFSSKYSAQNPLFFLTNEDLDNFKLICSVEYIEKLKENLFVFLTHDRGKESILDAICDEEFELDAYAIPSSTLPDVR